MPGCVFCACQWHFGMFARPASGWRGGGRIAQRETDGRAPLPLVAHRLPGRTRASVCFSVLWETLRYLICFFPQEEMPGPSNKGLDGLWLCSVPSTVPGHSTHEEDPFQQLSFLSPETDKHSAFLLSPTHIALLSASEPSCGPLR